MQGIHEGTGAMLLPVLLAATHPPHPPPPSSCATVYHPARVEQHAPSSLSPAPSSLLFLYFIQYFPNTPRALAEVYHPLVLVLSQQDTT